MTDRARLTLSAVQSDPDIEASVVSVLRSGQWAQGAMTERLESLWATQVGARHAIAVSSGTTALEIALRAHGIGEGDEVITSAFSFAATVNAVLHVGAVVRLVDIDHTWCIDASQAIDAITPRTRAMMPVHLYGYPVDIDAMVMACAATAQPIAMIEDAAQAVGACRNGYHVGSQHCACFSMYATKNVASGEGGMITVDDDGLADTMRLMRSQGIRRDYMSEIPGFNARLSDVHAAIAVPQMERFTADQDRRSNIAHELTVALSDIAGVTVPDIEPERQPGWHHGWHRFVVGIGDDARCTRDELRAQLAARGIDAGVVYPHSLADMPVFRNHPRVHAPNDPVRARHAAAHNLALPAHAKLSDNDVDYLIRSVRDILA